MHFKTNLMCEVKTLLFLCLLLALYPVKSNAKDNGSTFWFTLPYMPIQTAKIECPEIVGKKEEVEKDKLTILIAEDNMSNYKFNMLELNGYEATSEIRKISEQVPIIAVTAYATDEERIMSSGCTDYAAKPINAKVLKDKIFRQLKRRLIFI